MIFTDKYYDLINKYKDAHERGIYTRGSRNPSDKTPLRAIAPKSTMVGHGVERWAGWLATNTICARMLGGERFNGSVLDYGSGKPTDWYFNPGKNLSPKTEEEKLNFLYPYEHEDYLDYIGIDKNNVHKWDPAIKGIDHPLPNGAQWDQVWCLDVLEHIPLSDLDAVLDDLFRRTRVALSIIISTSPGKQMFRNDNFDLKFHDLKERGEDLYNLDDISEEERSQLQGGEDLHCTVRSAEWWKKKLDTALSRNWPKDKSEPRIFRACIKSGPTKEDKSTYVQDIRYVGINNVGLSESTLPKLNRKTWWIDYDKTMVITDIPYKSKYPKFKEEKWPKEPPKRGHANMIFWKKTNMKEHEENKKRESKSGEWKKSSNMVKRPRPLRPDGTPQ